MKTSAQQIGVTPRQVEASLNYHIGRGNLLTEMIRLFSLKSPIGEILEKLTEKSTDVLGDAAFIALATSGALRLEAAYCVERERLVRMLIAAWNAEPGGVTGRALS